MTLMAKQGGMDFPLPPSTPTSASATTITAEATATATLDSMDLREARLTILRAVSQGSLSAEDAEKLLFKD